MLFRVCRVCQGIGIGPIAVGRAYSKLWGRTPPIRRPGYIDNLP